MSLNFRIAILIGLAAFCFQGAESVQAEHPHSRHHQHSHHHHSHHRNSTSPMMLAPMYVPASAYGYPSFSPPAYMPAAIDPDIEKASRMGFVGGMLPGVGFQVTDVGANGPAELAGLQVGDVLVAANGIPLRSYNDAMRALRNSRGMMVLDVIDADGFETRIRLRF